MLSVEDKRIEFNLAHAGQLHGLDIVEKKSWWRKCLFSYPVNVTVYRHIYRVA